MNGKPLPKIHGYPLRVVVTGYIGARSTKWLYKINALAEPSMGPVQSQEYLYYTQQIGKQNAKYSNGFSIQNMPVSSVSFFACFVGFTADRGIGAPSSSHWTNRSSCITAKSSSKAGLTAEVETGLSESRSPPMGKFPSSA